LDCQIITHCDVRLRAAPVPITHDGSSHARRVTRLPRRQRPRIAPERWPMIAADAGALGLRQAARQHGVSHEAVRQIVLRVAAAKAAATPVAVAG
jgi:hypothetical protein